MKNRLYLLVLLLPAYLLMSYSSGAPLGKTGSPGDGGNTCTVCHTHTTSYMPNIAVTGLPYSGYIPGHSYRITLYVSGVSNTVTGFEATIENASNMRVGNFASADANTQALNSGQYITHTTAGTALHQWSFDWTAPATSQGDLHFYYAVNFANGDGNTTGDYIENGNFSLTEDTSGINDNQKDDFVIFPNPTTDAIYLNTNVSKAKIIDMQGKVFAVSTKNNRIDVRFLPSGTYMLVVENENVSKIKRFIKK